MFERFSDRARRAVILAQEEARLLSHDQIGGEHLLLGLLHENEGIAARTLQSLKIGLETARAQAEALAGRGQQVPPARIPFSEEAQEVLRLSQKESIHLGHNYIGTEHLLLGLVRLADGVAAQVLVGLGADLDSARLQVTKLLYGHAAGSAAREGPPGQHRQRGLPAEEVLARLEFLDRRLAAIERWVGLRPRVQDLDEQIERLRGEREDKIDGQDLDAAASRQESESELKAQKAKRIKEWAAGPSLAEEVARLSKERAANRSLADEVARLGKEQAASSSLAEEVARLKERAADPPPTDPSLADEVARLRAELALLHAFLRDHSIDPDDVPRDLRRPATESRPGNHAAPDPVPGNTHQRLPEPLRSVPPLAGQELGGDRGADPPAQRGDRTPAAPAEVNGVGQQHRP